MSITINGTLAPILVSTREVYDPQRGLTVTQEYESAGDGLNGLASQCIDQGIAYELTRSGRKSKLTLTAPINPDGQEIQPDSWQLLANELQKDIKEHPKVLSLPATGTTGSLADVLKQVEAHNNGGTPTTLTGDSLLLYNLMIRGVTSFPVGQFVLKHNTNVSNRYASNVADQGIEAIYTTGQLITEIANPVFWRNPCPGRLVAKIQSMQVQIEDNVDARWGWRKLPSQETTGSNNRIDISTEYWLASWSRLLYVDYVSI